MLMNYMRCDIKEVSSLFANHVKIVVHKMICTVVTS